MSLSTFPCGCLQGGQSLCYGTLLLRYPSVVGVQDEELLWQLLPQE